MVSEVAPRACRPTGAPSRSRWPPWAGRSTTFGPFCSRTATPTTGFAERARRAGVGIRVHELDAALARSEVPNPSKRLGPVRLMPVLRFLAFAARHRLIRIPKIQHVATFGDGATLEVPGAPVVIHMPGHTPGSAALHFAGHDALFVGDALVTYAVTTGRSGPQIAPFTADEPQARKSLERIADIQATFVLPGHGPAWRGGAGAAVEAVHAAARSAPDSSSTA